MSIGMKIAGISSVAVISTLFTVAVRRRMTRALESMNTAASRLESQLVATQTTDEGRAEARRIAEAIRITYNRNGKWQYPSLHLKYMRDERQKGIYCAEWTEAFFDATAFEIKQSATRHFQVEIQSARVPNTGGDEYVHLWIKITPKNGGVPVYVDDAFSNGLFVHEEHPIPERYQFDGDGFLRDHNTFQWNFIDAYSSSGEIITDPEFTGVSNGNFH